MARALSSLESEFGENPVGTERNLLDRLRNCLPSSVAQRGTVIRQTPPATPPTTPSLGTKSTRGSTAGRDSVLVCGYENASSDSHISGSENCSDRKQAQVQRVLSGPAAVQVTGQLSQCTSDTHTCTLSSTTHTSPVLQGGRLSSTPITTSSRQASLTPVSQSTILVSNPANRRRRLSLPSSARFTTGENIDNIEHNSASTYPRKLDALLDQLHDDHHDFEFNLQQFPASELMEEYQVKRYEENLNLLERLAQKVSRTFSKITSNNNLDIDPETVEAWRNKTSTLARNLRGYRQEMDRRIKDIQPDPALQRQATHPASDAGPNQAEASLADMVRSMSLGQQDGTRHKKQATLEVRTKMGDIRIDLEDITGKYSKYLDWNDAENHEVEEAMSKDLI